MLAGALHRLAQTIWVILQIGNGGRLGANMPARQRIIGIAFDRKHRPPLYLNQQTTIGFAQMASAVMDGGHGSLLVDCKLCDWWRIAT